MGRKERKVMRFGEKQNRPIKINYFPSSSCPNKQKDTTFFSFLTLSHHRKSLFGIVSDGSIDLVLRNDNYRAHSMQIGKEQFHCNDCGICRLVGEVF